MNVIVPILASGAAVVAVASLMHEHKEHKRMVRQATPRPLSIRERTDRLKNKCHQYIDITALDRRDVRRKRHLLDRSLREHCHKHLPPMLMHRAHPADISKRCVAICEKCCAEFNIALKPRCEPPHMDRNRYHSNLAVNIFQLDYNHAPPITGPGIGGRRSIL